MHNQILNHCEEIAFYNGKDWEKSRIIDFQKKLTKHNINVNYQRLYTNTFENIYARYGSIMIGYTVVALPIFGPQGIAVTSKDASTSTQIYAKNASLLVSLGKAIAKIVMCGKEISNIKFYTNELYRVLHVLNEIQKGNIDLRYSSGQQSVRSLNAQSSNDHILQGESVKFDNVTIASPHGEILIKNLKFEIKKGMNLLISGPNGCGKSSIFRVLGELWPVINGQVTKPPISQIFYIPQRPYLPFGTLRDQIIYPDSISAMNNKGLKDGDLVFLLHKLKLEYLLEREGLDATANWNNQLSGGEKQRIAMARLFYHRPTFALLDEATSAISVEIEPEIYKFCRKLDITVISVAHKLTLRKYHNYVLEIDEHGKWNFERIQQID